MNTSEAFNFFKETINDAEEAQEIVDFLEPIEDSTRLALLITSMTKTQLQYVCLLFQVKLRNCNKKIAELQSQTD